MKKYLTLASLFLAATVAACATSDPADTKLSSQVKQAINSHSALLIDVLRVQAADHVVYLYGDVDTWVEYYEAEKIASAVPGVARIVNSLAIRERYG